MNDERKTRLTQKIDVFITFLPDDPKVAGAMRHRKLLRLWVECDGLGVGVKGNWTRCKPSKG
jgi:hypothetical protein